MRDKDGLSAVAVGVSCFLLTYNLFIFLRKGTTGLTAQARGAGSTLEVVATMIRSVVSALVIGGLLIAFRHLLIDEIKKRNRRPQMVFDEHIEKVGDGEDRRSEELTEILIRHLDSLPENHRTALLLRVQRELSYREIAEVMQTTEASVKTWIHRARLELRQSLSNLRQL